MEYTRYEFKSSVTKFDFDNHSYLLKAERLLGNTIKVFQISRDYFTLNDETSFIVPNDIAANIREELTKDGELCDRFEETEVTEYNVRY